jgi:hypothetical protein
VEFTVEEWLTYIEVLRWTWADDTFTFHDYPPHKQEQHIAKVNKYEKTIETQLDLLSQIIGHPAIRIPQFDQCQEQTFEVQWEELNAWFLRGKRNGVSDKTRIITLATILMK